MRDVKITGYTTLDARIVACSMFIKQGLDASLSANSNAAVCSPNCLPRRCSVGIKPMLNGTHMPDSFSPDRLIFVQSSRPMKLREVGRSFDRIWLRLETSAMPASGMEQIQHTSSIRDISSWKLTAIFF